MMEQEKQNLRLDLYLKMDHIHMDLSLMDYQLQQELDTHLMVGITEVKK